MLVYCWTNVYDAGPTLSQELVSPWWGLRTGTSPPSIWFLPLHLCESVRYKIRKCQFMPPPLPSPQKKGISNTSRISADIMNSSLHRPTSVKSLGSKRGAHWAGFNDDITWLRVRRSFFHSCLRHISPLSRHIYTNWEYTVSTNTASANNLITD